MSPFTGKPQNPGKNTIDQKEANEHSKYENYLNKYKKKRKILDQKNNTTPHQATPQQNFVQLLQQAVKKMADSINDMGAITMMMNVEQNKQKERSPNQDTSRSYSSQFASKLAEEAVEEEDTEDEEANKFEELMKQSNNSSQLHRLPPEKTTPQENSEYQNLNNTEAATRYMTQNEGILAPQYNKRHQHFLPESCNTTDMRQTTKENSPTQDKTKTKQKLNPRALTYKPKGKEKTNKNKQQKNIEIGSQAFDWLIKDIVDKITERLSHRIYVLESLARLSRIQHNNPLNNNKKT
jgi:hypothetical protein